MKPQIRPSLRHGIIVSVAALAITSARGAIVSLEGIGDLAGGWTASWATDVSADGKYVLGVGSIVVDMDGLKNRRQGFRWSDHGAKEPFGVPSERGLLTEPLGNTLSGDGRIVGGEYYGPGTTGLGSSGAYLWGFGVGGVTEESIGGSAHSFSRMLGASATGDVLVGKIAPGGNYSNAVRKTSAGVVELVPVGVTQIWGSSANAVTSDGTKVAGVGPNRNVPEVVEQAFLWTTDSGLSFLPDLPGGTNASVANGISDDGSVVVGWGSSANGPEATRWVNGVPFSLGLLPGYPLSNAASDVSADGSIIVGYGIKASDLENGIAGGPQAFLWSESTGMVNLSEYLGALGVDLGGWQLQEATAISKDGTTIVGNGLHNGVQEGWVATIPEPSAAVLLLCSALGFSRRRRALPA